MHIVGAIGLLTVTPTSFNCSLTRANYLGSVPLVVAYALTGTVDNDFETEPIGTGNHGKKVYFRDIWPFVEEIAQVESAVLPEMFKKTYEAITQGNPMWNQLSVPSSTLYTWDPTSTYINKPTTVHISPVGNIHKDSPTAKDLMERGVDRKDFNSYGTEYGSGSSRDWVVRGYMLLDVKSVIAKSLKEMNAHMLCELQELQESSQREVNCDRECVMCRNEEVSVVFLPCAQQVVCVKCNDLYEKQRWKDCPSCRIPIQQRVHVYGVAGTSQMPSTNTAQFAQNASLSFSMKLAMLKRNAAVLFSARFLPDRKPKSDLVSQSIASCGEGSMPTCGLWKVQTESGNSIEKNQILTQDIDIRTENAADATGGVATDQCKGQSKNCPDIVGAILDLEIQLKEQTEWAHQKAMQAARKLSKELAELKTLRMERDETFRLDKQALEDTTMKILSEMENALQKESEDGDSIEEDSELDSEGSQLQKHAKSPKLAQDFLLDAATVIYKEQVGKAFRDHSIFACLALSLLEECVHFACKEIITLEKKDKFLEEEDDEEENEGLLALGLSLLMAANKC
eukprot:Gb_03662 [translate_table: standard]